METGSCLIKLRALTLMELIPESVFPFVASSAVYKGHAQAQGGTNQNHIRPQHAVYLEEGRFPQLIYA